MGNSAIHKRRLRCLMVIVFFKDKKSEYRWRMLADNGRIVADSGEGYKNKTDCLSGIELVFGKISSSESGKSAVRHGDEIPIVFSGETAKEDWFNE